jgi:hypothetical protein
VLLTGKPPNHKHPPDEGEDTISEKDGLPRPNARWWALYETEAIGHQSAYNLLRAIHHIPVSDNLSLFISPIPHRTKDQKCGLADSFENPKKSADSDEGRVVPTRSMACKHYAPCHDIEAEILCNWYSLDDPVGREFDNEHSDVNTRCKPGPLVGVLALSSYVYSYKSIDFRSSHTLLLSFKIGISSRMPMMAVKDIVPLSNACKK